MSCMDPVLGGLMVLIGGLLAVGAGGAEVAVVPGAVVIGHNLF